THRVPSVQFPDLIEALCSGVPVDAALNAFAQAVTCATVAEQSGAVGRLFHGNTVEDILAALDAEAEHGASATLARRTAASIRAKSPLSVKIALAQLRRGLGLDFDECMRTEFRVVSRIVYGHDFYEGIRAVIIDKDQTPHWRPSSLAEVG